MIDTSTPEAKAAFAARLKSYEGIEVGQAQVAPDDVNVPMIRHWCEAIGDRNPVYLDPQAAAESVHGGLVAPPTMLQAWVMAPFGSKRESAVGANPYVDLLNLVDEAGFVSVVATNCEQTYDRYLRPGDRLTMRTTIDSVSEEKTTGLGTGHFITSRLDYFDQHGVRVASMLFRILKFRAPQRPPAPPPKPQRPRPAITKDMEFWFEGLRHGTLLIQRCTACGTLRHPAGPTCRNCRSFDWDSVPASGRGRVHSFVVTHYPQVPSFDYPLPIVLVELDEGVRIVADAIDTDPGAIAIGDRVEIVIRAVDDDLSLPFARVTR
jgi:uncharacterized OB-fold protein/acyl dehydratase